MRRRFLYRWIGTHDEWIWGQTYKDGFNLSCWIRDGRMKHLGLGGDYNFPPPRFFIPNARDSEWQYEGGFLYKRASFCMKNKKSVRPLVLSKTKESLSKDVPLKRPEFLGKLGMTVKKRSLHKRVSVFSTCHATICLCEFSRRESEAISTAGH